ncbi:PHP domain-containing protein [Thiospirochaeta perfilievii]|uniref:DNA polymerase III subunit alpha n=1 Tax=Thiospirochaeta perfilievii TaxID=252967 RepID=A0A5C1Q8M9_9SPIO|nr:PHP domain-containing protein [Thiospirochaeta perfilievii]QEN03319.1 PHP domain-containing protein [Thiospirochaeta perfilievii]
MFTYSSGINTYSLGRSTIKIKDLIIKAKENGMNYLGLTDYGNMFGIIEFYTKCKENNIKPVIGLEIKVVFNKVINHNLLLFAEDIEGYKNLMKISSLGYKKGDYDNPFIFLNDLKLYKKGIIATSSFINSKKEDIELHAKLLHNIFGNYNFYLELQNHGLEEDEKRNAFLLNLSIKNNIPIVVTNYACYLEKNHSSAHSLLRKITNTKDFITSEYYLKPTKTMTNLFKHFPEAIENTVRIAKRCHFDIEVKDVEMPNFFIPKLYNSPEEYLHYLCFKGLKERKIEESKTVVERINLELKQITDLKLSIYFLIHWDLKIFAEDKDIFFFIGSGKIKGSLVAYLLFISDIDPIKYNLHLFYSLDKSKIPFITLDVCYERKEEIVDYLIKKYGEANCARTIFFFPRLNGEKLLKRALKALGISVYKIKKSSSYMADINIVSGAPLQTKVSSTNLLITKESINNYIPFYKEPYSGHLVSQYKLENNWDFGVLNISLMPYKLLSRLKKIEESIKTYEPNFNIAKIPTDDESTFKFLCDAERSDLHNLDFNLGASNILVYKPKNIEDLITIDSFTFSPLEITTKYLEGKNNPEKIKYIHQNIKCVLNKTHGVLIFKEQIIDILTILLGCNSQEAEFIRTNYINDNKNIDTLINKAVGNGYDIIKAKEILNLLISYSNIVVSKFRNLNNILYGYKIAYLKVNYPNDFKTLDELNL